MGKNKIAQLTVVWVSSTASAREPHLDQGARGKLLLTHVSIVLEKRLMFSINGSCAPKTKLHCVPVDTIEVVQAEH